MSATSTNGSESPNGAPPSQQMSLAEKEMSLVEEVRSTYAKLKGMQELETQAIFARDSKRLDAKARATYRALGLTVNDAPGDLQMIADNVTLDDSARGEIFNRLDNADMGDVRIVADNITFSGGAKPAPSDSTANTPPPVPAPSDATSGPGKLGIAAAIVAAALGGGGMVGIASYFLNREAPRVVVQPAEPSVDTDTNAGLRFGPDQ